MDDPFVRGDVDLTTMQEASPLIRNLMARVTQLELKVSDLEQRLDTLQTPLWKRALFRIDGWPGQRNLNAEGPSWRPWHSWGWRS